MQKCVIFDLDGVLVSTDEMHYQAWKRLADEIGIADFTQEDNRRQRGISRMASLEILLEKSDKVYSQLEKEELARKKNSYYLERLDNLSERNILPGAKETLRCLKSRNVVIAVGSSSKNAPLILEKTGLLPWIDQVSCGLDTSCSKPAPDIFLIAAKKAGTETHHCLVVEDSAAGIKAAAAGGMKSLAVGPLYRTLRGDFCARSLAEVNNWEMILDSVS